MGTLKSRTISLIWPIIGLAAMIFVWFLPWRFQVNDDVLMMWLVSGAYTGDFENYAVFIHPALSWAFSQLYGASVSIPWYSVLWFSCVYYSFLLIHVRIKKSVLPASWRLFFNLLTLAISIHLYIFPQFTLVSGFLALSAWIYHFQDPPAKGLSPSLHFLIAVSFSIMIRAEAFLLVFVGLIFFSFVMKFNFKAYRRSFFIVPIIFTLLISSKVLFEQNSKYADFLQFNTLRHKVIDHPVFYEKTKDLEFIRDSKWHYFSNWFFQNSGVSLDDLRTKKQLLDKEYFSSKYMLKSFARYWEVQTAEMFKGFVTVLLLLLFVAVYRKDKKLVFLVIWLSLFFLANHIFHFRGRVVFLFFIVLLFPILDGNFKKIAKYIPGLLAVAIALVLSIHFLNFRDESDKRKKYLEEFEVLLLESNKTGMLMLEGLPLEYFSQMYNHEKQVPFFINGWVSRSPFQDKALKRFGYQSLQDVNNFDLIAVKENAPFDTKDFMDSIGTDFFLTKTHETENLVLFKYMKHPSDN